LYLGTSYRFFGLSNNWQICEELAIEETTENQWLGVAVVLVLMTIFIYISGYLRNEPESVRYVTFVTIFVFGMLIMIYTDSLLVLLIGWEVIGIASYLLIG